VATADGGVITPVADALQLGLGVVLLLAAVPKLRRPAAFADTVRDYRVLPPGLAPAAASVLIAAESLLAASLLTGVLATAAPPLTIALLLCFLAAVGINLRRGRRVPCGCFGETSQALSARTLARLALLLAAAALLLGLRAAGAVPLTVSGLVADGWTGLAYGAQEAGLAAFLLMVGAWALNLPELARLLSRPARPAGPPDVPTATESR
jgi:Methylamine utilisation protein MauE